MDKTTDWMLTYTGIHYYPMEPNRRDVCIEDIAHALSRICRFGGHIQNGEHYSVAEHSLLVCDQVLGNYKLPALLHDGSDTYVNDMVRPLKQYLPEFRDVERLNQNAIMDRFGLQSHEMYSSVIKAADNAVLAAEAWQVMNADWRTWNIDIDKPADVVIRFLSPNEAKKLFLERFYELYSTHYLALTR